MQVAAESGYHPDYAILAAQRLRAVTGDQSKFTAFFSSHPRWATRQERAERNYDWALAAFNRQWKSAQNSPGGLPPTMASFSPIKVENQAGGKMVRTAVTVRNIRETPVTLTARLVGEHGPQPVIAFERSFTADLRTPDSVAFEVPKEMLKDRKGKQYIRLTLHGGSEILSESEAIKIK